MSKKTSDALFLENLEKFVKGQCYLCKKQTQDDGYVHYDCAVSYSDTKRKRINEAWKKALGENNVNKTTL